MAASVTKIVLVDHLCVIGNAAFFPVGPVLFPLLLLNSVDMYVCMYDLYVCMYVCMQACMHVCMYVCIQSIAEMLYCRWSPFIHYMQHFLGVVFSVFAIKCYINVAVV